jgi:tRNA G37 N-methylase Trm5
MSRPRSAAQCCANGGLMLDVGANFGYYSFYAAKMGCRVVAWEPIPIFRAFVEAGLALNNLTHRVHLRSNVVSDVGGKSIQMTVPQRGIWGTASVGGLHEQPCMQVLTTAPPSPTGGRPQCGSVDPLDDVYGYGSE